MKKAILLAFCLFMAICLSGCCRTTGSVRQLEERLYAYISIYLSAPAEAPKEKKQAAQPTAVPVPTPEEDAPESWMDEPPTFTPAPEEAEMTPTPSPTAPQETPGSQGHGGVIQLPIGP